MPLKNLSPTMLYKIKLMYQMYFTATEASIYLRLAYQDVRHYYARLKKENYPKMDRFDMLPSDIRRKVFFETVTT